MLAALAGDMITCSWQLIHHPTAFRATFPSLVLCELDKLVLFADTTMFLDLALCANLGATLRTGANFAFDISLFETC
jgi:hypothetical protein